MIYDFHSHALFGIDDGAKDIEMSKKMLLTSKEMGVDCVLLTPHLHPRLQEDIDTFIEKRDTLYNELAKDSSLPKLVKACELQLTCDLTKFSGLDRLCIDNTKYILLEMPYTPWSDRTIENAYRLTLKGYIPIIAHDERNIPQNPELRNALYDLNVLIQVNASSFLPASHRRGKGLSVVTASYKREIERMMKLGLVHVIGTDMHNMTTRKPCMDEALKRIQQCYGSECVDYLMNNAERILAGETLSYRDFKSFKRKLFR
jgi:protein-tyrosine phosphatase